MKGHECDAITVLAVNSESDEASVAIEVNCLIAVLLEVAKFDDHFTASTVHEQSVYGSTYGMVNVNRRNLALRRYL